MSISSLLILQNIICEETINLICLIYEWKTIHTWKYVLHADSTTLCAFKCFPSAAKVTSTNDSLFNKLENMEMKLGWWLFHLRQNCCTAISVNSQIIIKDTVKSQKYTNKSLYYSQYLKWIINYLIIFIYSREHLIIYK